jgi:hypothetical protein
MRALNGTRSPDRWGGWGLVREPREHRNRGEKDKGVVAPVRVGVKVGAPRDYEAERRRENE